MITHSMSKRITLSLSRSSVRSKLLSLGMLPEEIDFARDIVNENVYNGLERQRIVRDMIYCVERNRRVQEIKVDEL